jgi:phosphoserine phosphatase RsbU/P
VRPDAAYAAERIQLAPGEGVYLFTDGVTEAANPREELFSEARLEDVLRGTGRRTSAEIVQAVTAAVRGFVAGAQPSDDITMLAVRRLEGMGQ